MGQGPVEVKHISQLHYVQACLRESIRLQPTAPAIGRSVRGTHPEPISGGRYLIPPGIDVVCLLGAIQRDPAVFGEEAGSFQPERMLEDEFRNLPSSSWKVRLTDTLEILPRPIDLLIVTKLAIRDRSKSLHRQAFCMARSDFSPCDDPPAF